MKTTALRPAAARPNGTRRRPLAIGIAALTALAFGASAPAATYYWVGDDNAIWNQPSSGPGGTNWSSSPDFNQGTPGTPNSLSADDVFFILAGAAPANFATTLGADTSIRSLTFTSDLVNALSIGGANTLTLGTGGVTDNAGAAITVSSAVSLGACRLGSTTPPTPTSRAASSPASRRII